MPFSALLALLIVKLKYLVRIHINTLVNNAA